MASDNQPPERKSLDDRNRMTELERIRHSCAHVMATAILRLWPEAQFAAGPPVENGFYYDVDLQHRISPEDFPAIEAEMKKEIKANHPFEKIVVTRDQALKDAQSGRLGALSERPAPSRFKIGNLEDIPEGEAISYYRNGDFLDLCAGPHVMRTGNIGAFKLTSVASAYYKGDERNPQLQRIYGTAFGKKAELDAWVQAQEEAKKRDHRKIGKEMGLFTISPLVGPGLVLWMPKGGIIRTELGNLMQEELLKRGYSPVFTPHIGHVALYKMSGHFPYYKDSQYPTIKGEGDEEYLLKPMNCPHHIQIYAAEPRSYRDLPIRLAEFGMVYRFEQSGELNGMTRVRGFTQDDAHLFCTPEQVEGEFRTTVEMVMHVFTTLGFADYECRVSLRDPNSPK